MASKPLRHLAALALGLTAALPSAAQAPHRQLAATSVEELKTVYLECDRFATRTLLDLGHAAHCSMVGEELKHRVFGGDFERLLAWWREQKSVAGEPGLENTAQERRLRMR